MHDDKLDAPILQFMRSWSGRHEGTAVAMGLDRQGGFRDAKGNEACPHGMPSCQAQRTLVPYSGVVRMARDDNSPITGPQTATAHNRAIQEVAGEVPDHQLDPRQVELD
ncbi:hypothetical protein [Pseudoroseomonas cervicalis]|uniref:hypothetical protein n=1 Tax=Teichococcus cervicalis TaxID=204525 RepID=UPI0022F16090|nr:hypothetical protein [Pseudoroseomonas cervicalis]WBV43002.1 hypothetical protein PFY06_00080 [Pseudoroseomonas cervicalis]